MKKNDLSVSDEKPKFPEWYWNRGLHDAKIVRIEKLELPYDYKQRVPTRNCFVVHMDSKQAMFDTSVREIRLFNYKILTAELSSPDIEGTYWITDQLTEENGKYVLQVELQNCGRNSTYNFILKIRFESAEIIRNGMVSSYGEKKRYR